MSFECSKELSHQDGSFDYPHHMFWLRKKKKNFQLCTLFWGPEFCVKKVHYLFEDVGDYFLKFPGH